MRVLIADHSKESRAIIARIFLKFSPKIEVKEVENGKQALRALTENTFDVIVTELDGDGEAFIKHLQSSLLLKHKPIIIYTNKGFIETTADNAFYVNKLATPPRELAIIIRELIFKYKICPKCDEAIDATTCNNICFYHNLDLKWQGKVKDLLK